MKIYTIYKATNLVNGKCYVGFDSNWPRRKRDHKSLAKLSRKYPFHKAIRKYGWESFHWEIIYRHWDMDYCLNIMEPLLIETLQAHISKHGYNVTNGGEGNNGYKISDYHRNVLKIMRIGKPLPVETKEKMKALWTVDRKEAWAKVQTGKKHSAETRNKMRESQLQRYGRKYEIISPTEGKLIIRDLVGFCKINGLLPNSMYKVCKGKSPTHRGYRCRTLNT